MTTTPREFDVMGGKMVMAMVSRVADADDPVESSVTERTGSNTL
jgi:hypothetical protein